MIRFFALLALTVLITVFSASEAMAQSSGRKFALVIGNANYLNTGQVLTNPINDAKAMKAQLETFGFDVTYKEDLKRVDMVREIKVFVGKLAKDDIVFVYYAGHGIELDGNNYLIPTDANIRDKDDVDGATVDFTRELLDRLAAKETINMIVVDACRENPFLEVKVKAGMAAVAPPRRTMVIMSAAPGEVAWDGGGGANSVFTLAFLKALRAPAAEINDAFYAASLEVGQVSNQRQTPQTYGTLSVRKFPLGGGIGSGVTPQTFAALPPQQPAALPLPTAPYVPSGGDGASAMAATGSSMPRPVLPPEPVFKQPPAISAPSAAAPQQLAGLPPTTAPDVPSAGDGGAAMAATGRSIPRPVLSHEPVFTQPPAISAPSAAAPQQMASLPPSTAPYVPSGGDDAAVMEGPTSRLGPPQFPSEPQMRLTPTPEIPERFCSEQERNAFNQYVLRPTQDDALNNATFARSYTLQLNALRERYRGDSTLYISQIIERAETWSAISAEAEKASIYLNDLFPVMMARPTSSCGRAVRDYSLTTRAQAAPPRTAPSVQLAATPSAQRPQIVEAPALAPVQLASESPMVAPPPAQIALPPPAAPAPVKPTPVDPAPAPAVVAAAPAPAPAPAKPASSLPPVNTQSSATAKWAEPPTAPAAPQAAPAAEPPPPTRRAAAPDPVPAGATDGLSGFSAPVVGVPSATGIKPPAPAPATAPAVKKPEPAPVQVVTAPPPPAVSTPRPSSEKWAEPSPTGPAPKPVQTAALTPPATAPAAPPKPVVVAPPAPKPAPPVAAKPAPTPPVQTAAPAAAPKPAPVAPAPAAGPSAASLRLALAVPPPSTPVAPPLSPVVETPATGKPGKGKPAVAPAPVRPTASPAVREIESGRALAARGDFGNALAAFERAVAAEPSNPDALVGRGYVRMLTDDDAGAQADFSKALTLRANFAEGFYFLGQLYKKKGLATAAIQQFDKALAINLAYARAYVAKGETLEALGRIPEAFAAYDQAVKSDPALIGAYIARGRGHFLQADYARAWDDFQAAIDKDPFSEDSFYARGRTELALKRFNEAVSTFEELAGRRPDYSVQCSRGMAYLERGLANREKKDRTDFQKAYDSFGEAILLRPGDTTEATNRQTLARAQASGRVVGALGGLATGWAGTTRPSLATLDPSKACAAA